MIASGDVLSRYPYLWRWQRQRGEDSGRKERPVCVAIASRDDKGFTHLALLEITSTPPAPNESAVEIPPLEAKRIGLDDGKRGWIIVSEYNYDILEKSFALAVPKEAPRRLSPVFLKTVIRAFRPTLLDRSARVDRL